MLRELDAGVEASGPHDFSVRKKALSSAAPPASIAPQPYVRDDRETPLCVGRDGGGYRSDLGQAGREIFFAEGWTANQFNNPLRLVPLEGRIAIVTNAGRDAVDADGARDERA